jgi:SEC-C motif-containing protein
MKDCPCGSDFPYTDCCGPIIRGAIPADTAEDLMRSRYTAFAKQEWDYIDQTQSRDNDPEKPDSSYYRQDNIKWTKLEILGSKNGGQSDKKGEVSFVAHYVEDDDEKILQETSKFIKKDGRWYYDEETSKVAPTSIGTSGKPFVRDQPKVGRNDPCICGSKKKYKKCCG